MTGQVYFWEENGAWQLARIVRSDFGARIMPHNPGFILMMPLYSTTPVWVPESKLRPYPSEPIPQPEAK